MRGWKFLPVLALILGGCAADAGDPTDTEGASPEAVAEKVGHSQSAVTAEPTAEVVTVVAETTNNGEAESGSAAGAEPAGESQAAVDVPGAELDKVPAQTAQENSVGAPLINPGTTVSVTTGGGKPQPDPWRNHAAFGPNKPQPDPWRGAGPAPAQQIK